MRPPYSRYTCLQTDISTAVTVMSKLDNDNSGFVGFDEFVVFNKKHPQLLFPAFRIQVTCHSPATH